MVGSVEVGNEPLNSPEVVEIFDEVLLLQKDSVLMS